jgi:hypothetical protein
MAVLSRHGDPVPVPVEALTADDPDVELGPDEPPGVLDTVGDHRPGAVAVSCVAAVDHESQR